jgi:hypothetical protein
MKTYVHPLAMYLYIQHKLLRKGEENERKKIDITI